MKGPRDTAWTDCCWAHLKFKIKSKMFCEVKEKMWQYILLQAAFTFSWLDFRVWWRLIHVIYPWRLTLLNFTENEKQKATILNSSIVAYLSVNYLNRVSELKRKKKFYSEQYEP